jgi:cell division protein FtsI (penicillin-binding protein 3)
MMRTPRRRVILISAFLTVWALVVAGRLFQIQIVRHDHYVTRAAKQQERTLDLAPVRGSIYDRKGRVLAESVVAKSIYADPQAVRDPRDTAKKLAAIKALGVSARDLERKLRNGSEFAWIARQVPDEVAAQVEKLSLTGIYSLEEHKRSYPKRHLAASVLGYVSVDGEGLAGVEHSFEEYVRGRSGKVTLLRDARRGMYLVGGEGKNAPVDGMHVVLTIDEVIQFISERALRKAVVERRATSGSVTVLDPASGAVLAMASYPDFDPNDFRSSPASSWRNRPVQDLYEPGSTFKIVTAAAGLEERLVTPSQLIDCGDGSIEIARTRIKEHGNHRYGLIAFEDVLAHSSNVGTIRVGLSLGQRRFYQYVRKFGFGEKSGIRLPGEGDGILRPPQRWSALSNAVISIGQEIAATPLQVAAATATIAAGGIRRQPYIVDRVVDEAGNVIWKHTPPPGERVVSEKTAAILNEMLKTVVLRGTGQKAALAEHVVAGKTGTAQKAARGGYSADKFVASFAGYVPADRPALVILVAIDEPRGEHYGGSIAAPVFKEIAESALRYMEVEPSVPVRRVPIPATRLAAFSQPQRPSGPAVASGAGAVVPDLRGLDARAAVARAVSSGFLVEATGSGVVTAQVPEPGESAPRRTIALTLKSPTEWIR